MAGSRALAAVGPEPLDVEDVVGRVGGDADGAVVIFLGTVRDHADGRPVTGMRYDAYVEMAVPVLEAIADEAATLLVDGGRVAVAHRTGELGIGEVSVAVAVSSPHRDEAYRASRHVIEEIKKRLPVWKKEFYDDGGPEWVEGHTPTPASGATPAGPAARAGEGGPR